MHDEQNEEVAQLVWCIADSDAGIMELERICRCIKGRKRCSTEEYSAGIKESTKLMLLV